MVPVKTALERSVGPFSVKGKQAKRGGLSQRSVVAELLSRVARSIAFGYKKNLSMSCESARLWLGQFRRRGKSGEKKNRLCLGQSRHYRFGDLCFWGVVVMVGACRMVADAIFCLSRSLSLNACSATSHPSLRKSISGRVSWGFSGVSWGLAFNLNNSFVFLNIVANSPFSALFVRGSAHR